MLNVSVSHDDLVVHPVWCDPEVCSAPDHLGDRRLHQSNLGYIKVAEHEGVEVALVKFDEDAPLMVVGDAALNLGQLEDLILLLDHARAQLIYAGGER